MYDGLLYLGSKAETLRNDNNRLVFPADQATRLVFPHSYRGFRNSGCHTACCRSFGWKCREKRAASPPGLCGQFSKKILCQFALPVSLAYKVPCYYKIRLRTKTRLKMTF